MSIYKRTIILICCTFVALMLVVYLASNAIYRQGFQDLEKETVEKNVTQATEALSARLDALDTLCYDWANWDDTYLFAQGFNQAYVDRNFQDETYASSKTNFISIFNTSGKMVHGKAYDLINSEEMALPDDLAGIMKAEGFTTLPDTENVVAGIVQFMGQPMLAVSRPVMTSLAEGPSTGAIIMGRFIDAEVIGDLSETTHLAISLLPIPADDSEPEENSLVKSLSESGSTYVEAQDEDTIAGYTYVKDLAGKPAFIFEVVIPRDIYRQATEAIAILHSFLVFIGIMFCVVFIVLIKRQVLSRLTLLSNSVSIIGSSGDITNRVIVQGNDELSGLEKNINKMLTSIEKTNRALQESEGKFSRAFRSSPQVICITRMSDGETIDVNDSFTRSTGYTREEIIGHTSTEFSMWKAGERERMLAMYREKGRVENEEFEFRRKSGEIRTQLFSAESIMIGGEECLISIITDITDRKRSEKLQSDEISVLTLLGRGAELNDLLDAIVRLGETHDPAIKGSVLLYDAAKGYLVQAAGPSLPPDYVELLNGGVPIGPNSGSCGTAAYRKQRVIIPDIESSHAFPDEVVKVTNKNGLLACWSQPIIASSGELLGTIANYSSLAGQPEPGDLMVIEWSARIAALAIERRNAEKALKESEEKFSKAFHASPDAISISRMSDGQFIELNESYIRNMGYTREEMVGLNATDLNLWAVPEQQENMLRKIREHIIMNNEEIQVRTRSGEIRTQLISSEYVPIGGEPCLLVVSTDITERKRMEESLADEATRRRILIEQSSDGIVILDQNGAVYEANRRFAEMLGYTPEEVAKLGVWDWEFQYPHEQVVEMIRTVDEKGDHFETRHRRKDGSTYDVEISTNGVMFAGQKLIFCVCRDITERNRMEKALRESEEKFSKAFRSSPATIAITTIKDGRYIEVNDSYMQSTGYTAKELIGRRTAEMNVWVNVKDRDRLFRIIRKQGRVSNEEFDFRMKSGEIRSWLFSAESIDIAGEPCLIGVSIDITERKKAEAALRESEEKFSVAFRSIPNTVAITTVENGEFIEINNSHSRLTGYTREETVGHTALELGLWVNPVERARMMGILKKQGRVDNEEFRFRMKSGEVRDWLFSAEQINIGGKPYLISITTDITEKKRMEQALRESEEKFSRAFYTIPEAISISRLSDGKFVEVNDTFTRVSGIPREQIIGHDSAELDLWLNKNERKDLIHLIKGRGRVENEEVQFQTKAGEVRTTLLSADIVNINGEPCLLIVSTDITERKRAEEKLKEALTDLERSSAQLASTNKELEAFSYSVSHDLRSPLRSIDGFSQALIEDYQDTLDAKGRDYLSRLRGASQKMGELIDGILKLSRLTRSEMRHETVDLSSLAREIAGRLQEMQPDRRAKFLIDDKLTATGDPQMMRVLLENLLGNAWKFTGKKSAAKIEFGMERQNGRSSYFIRDNGAGFDMTYSDKLFGAFQRLHEVTDFPGTGIGLATVQRIIHRHGGTIWAEGKVDKGAAFHFTLD